MTINIIISFINTPLLRSHTVLDYTRWISTVRAEQLRRRRLPCYIIILKYYYLLSSVAVRTTQHAANTPHETCKSERGRTLRANTTERYGLGRDSRLTELKTRHKVTADRPGAAAVVVIVVVVVVVVVVADSLARTRTRHTNRNTLYRWLRSVDGNRRTTTLPARPTVPSPFIVYAGHWRPAPARPSRATFCLGGVTHRRPPRPRKRSNRGGVAAPPPRVTTYMCFFAGLW
ncbi:hypothetical protein AGLY_001367 [Aphis glycines]|uniref:Uncharacterized protein n=1 Tax=Aphis glycines TaxID=307491 RepID=A0A6G0U4Z6_APHGL|nr:hypothetical protein AGLY_001367 [Aphis glycines]